MTDDRPVRMIPATPAYVLAVLRDGHRQQCRVDFEAEPEADLTFATTIAEWQSACDLISTRALAPILDEEWGLGRPAWAWREVLEPSGTRTLGDLCGFIARGAIRPTVEPARLLGKTCLPAGAFLRIRSLLRDAGADEAHLRPSTALDEYARLHLAVFLGPISRLAPGALPGVEACWGWTARGVGFGMTVMFPWFTLIVGVSEASLWLGAGFFLACAIFGLMPLGPAQPPERAEFPGLQTFGDLARVVAAGSPRIEMNRE